MATRLLGRRQLLRSAVQAGTGGMALSLLPRAARAASTGAVAPEIDGEWWQVAGDPDLGTLTTPEQQPVDFGIWQAADGTWQLWSCIRKTKETGTGRLFHGWEGARLTDADWTPRGIQMRASTAIGEVDGGLQAPYVKVIDGRWHMFYGSWQAIWQARSSTWKSVILLAPLCPSTRRDQVASTPLPSGVTMPRPVTTTRRMKSCPVDQ